MGTAYLISSKRGNCEEKIKDVTKLDGNRHVKKLNKFDVLGKGALGAGDGSAVGA